MYSSSVYGQRRGIGLTTAQCRIKDPDAAVTPTAMSLVSQRTAHFGSVQMFEILIELSANQAAIKVFSDETEALRWLASPMPAAPRKDQ